VIVVGGGTQVFLVKNIFLDGLASRIPVFFRKGETIQNRDTQMLQLHRRKRYRNKHNSEDIVTAIVSWSILSLHVCV
jgi:hypothetical protein